MDPTRQVFTYKPDVNKKFIVHCVRNHLRYKRQSGAGPEVVGSVASQYNIAYLFGDVMLYSVNGSSINSEDIAALKEQQRVIGEEGFNQLTAGSVEGQGIQQPAPVESGIMRTVFRPDAIQLKKTFRPFKPEHCALLDLFVL